MEVSRKRVLVVEDVEDARLLLKHMIEQAGVSVIEAAGAYEAVEKAEEYLPDLILMDIGLPLLDGLSVANTILRQDKLKETPIVAVTAYRDVLEQATKAGCCDVLYKPFDQPALNEVLKKHLNGH